MFTGIIETTAHVRELEKGESTTRLTVEPQERDRLAGARAGESVCVDGVCLTLTEDFDRQGLARFFVSSETLARSSLGQLVVGSRVNLERALAMGGRMGGHWVQGHVDGVGIFEGATSLENGSYQASFTLPQGLSRYCVEKGSIALNGVSLTINALSPLQVCLIPHTWRHTTLSELKPGNRVNVEVDILAKYVESLLEKGKADAHPRD